MSTPRVVRGGAPLAEGWAARWRRGWSATRVLVLLAATETAAVPGISAAGATPESRRATPAADAELLIVGPEGHRPHALPPLPAGVSPALISHVVLKGLGIAPLVVDLGCAMAPAVPHLRLPAPAGGGSSRCLSSGEAMSRRRVEALLEQGRLWGRRLAEHAPDAPLLIGECVPGGTSTAQGVLCGLGVEAAGLVSGSLRQPAHDLKTSLLQRGAQAAGLELGRQACNDPLAVVAALGDPMQPLAAGLLLEAAMKGVPVMLAGGSQMAAVLALALTLAWPSQRAQLLAATALVTTRWVALEPGSDLARLLDLVGERWLVEPLAFCSSFGFPTSCHPALLAYEEGYVKEGVGAGGLAALWELSGRDPLELARCCSEACDLLLPSPMARSGQPLRSSYG